MSRNLGLITIGQSPRPDITGNFRDALVDADVNIIERGLLDGLTLAQVWAGFSPTDADADATVYVSRMGDGTEIKLLKQRVEEGLQRELDKMAPECDLIVVLCTGTFKHLTAPVPLIYPDAVLQETAKGMGIVEAMHIVAPAEEQRPFLEAKWKNTVKKLTFTISSPYQEFLLANVVRDISSCAPQGVVLDCMGFQRKHRDLIQSEFGQDLTVILPQVTVPEYVGRVLASS